VQVIHERHRLDTDTHHGNIFYPWLWVKNFQSEDIDFLFNQPYTVTVPSYNATVVHAGLVPGASLDCQRPIDMTTMRGIVKDSDGGYVGTQSKTVGPWAACWPGPQHIYFGHNASRGLQRHPFATGLDTGCVYGRELTGVMISAPSEQPVLYSVPAKQVYSVPNK